MHPDTLGWTAAALMMATFSCREARHLRPLAVATNVAFAGYGAAAGLMPVLALHLLLLPINLWRWAQALALSRRGVQQAAGQYGRLLCVMVLSALSIRSSDAFGMAREEPWGSARGALRCSALARSRRVAPIRQVLDDQDGPFWPRPPG
jgi:hypothetical protein